MAKEKKRRNKTAYVYIIVKSGNQNGDWEYDDENNYYQTGAPDEELPTVYSTREDADRACEALDNDTTEWMGDYGPFYDPYEDYGGDGYEWDYSQHVLLPWPQFCDWCKDHNLPRPYIDELDGDGKVVENPDPEEVRKLLELDESGLPEDIDFDREDFAEWWNQDVLKVYDKDEAIALFTGVVKGPQLHSVRQRTVERNEIKELEQKLRAMKAAIKAANGAETKDV